MYFESKFISPLRTVDFAPIRISPLRAVDFAPIRISPLRAGDFAPVRVSPLRAGGGGENLIKISIYTRELEYL